MAPLTCMIIPMDALSPCYYVLQKIELFSVPVLAMYTNHAFILCVGIITFSSHFRHDLLQTCFQGLFQDNGHNSA